MSTNIETAMLSIVYLPPPKNRLYCLTFKSWHICLTSGKNDQKWDNEVEIDKQQPIWKFEITNLSQALPQATANEILIISRFLLWIDNMVTTTTGTILQDHGTQEDCKSAKWGHIAPPKSAKWGLKNESEEGSRISPPPKPPNCLHSFLSLWWHRDRPVYIMWAA